MGPSSGPINMAPHDTQEVIYACVSAGGNNRIESIKLLKYYQAIAKNLYDSLFNHTPLVLPSDSLMSGAIVSAEHVLRAHFVT